MSNTEKSTSQKAFAVMIAVIGLALTAWDVLETLQIIFRFGIESVWSGGIPDFLSFVLSLLPFILLSTHCMLYLLGIKTDWLIPLAFAAEAIYYIWRIISVLPHIKYSDISNWIDLFIVLLLIVASVMIVIGFFAKNVKFPLALLGIALYLIYPVYRIILRLRYITFLSLLYSVCLFALYLFVLLFVQRTKYPDRLSGKRSAAPVGQPVLTAEEQLRVLIAQYQAGGMTEEAYQRARADIISKL